MRFLLFLGIWMTLQSFAFAQKVVLKIPQVPTPRIEANYQIFEVQLSATQADDFGQVFYRPNLTAPVFFDGELPQLILDRYSSLLKQESSNPHAISIKIQNFHIQERFNAASRLYEGDLNLKLNYYLNQGETAIFLVSYTNKVTYQRSLNGINKLQETVQEYLDKSLAFFNSWMTKEGRSLLALAQEVRLEILDPIRSSTPDTVFYREDNLLLWENFRDTPNFLSQNNAVISTSFSIEAKAELQDGIIYQVLDIKVFMLPKQSWVKKPDDYALNHERKHFDLVRIVVDRMKEKLLDLELNPSNFQARINEVFLDSYREMNSIQEAYDQQTSNGLNKEKQAQWNQWIRLGLNGNRDPLLEFF